MQEEVETYEKLGGHLVANADLASVAPNSLEEIFNKIEKADDIEDKTTYVSLILLPVFLEFFKSICLQEIP